MKALILVLSIASVFASNSGADIVKVRLNNDSYRIILTGADAQLLSASAGKVNFSSSSPVSALNCTESPLRCEILVNSGSVQSYENVQEHLRMAKDLGMPGPRANLPQNSGEQLLMAQVDDSSQAGKLYALLPGPETTTHFENTIAAGFTGKSKALVLPGRTDVTLSCQQLERLGGSSRKGYSCVMSAIVPTQDTRQAQTDIMQ